MPATSKKQQKFMGIVHAIQKGEQPASKFSKAAQKAAKSMKKKSAEDYASTKHKGLPTKVKKEERDYKAEYKKFQSSTKAKKYRAELNQYNRKRGTYGNGDGKDASHKGGKIVGFEKESKNRGRAEKSRLKKEAIFEDLNDAQLSSRIKHWAGQHKGTGVGYGHVLGSLAIHLKEMGWDKSFKEIVKVAKELSKKKKVESVFAVKGKEGKDGYRSPENPDFKYDPEKKESVNEELYNSQGEQTDFKNGDMVKDINPGCPHVGSEGEVTKVGTGTITFKVTNNGKTYQEGDELEKTVEQMVKLKESVNEGKWSKIMTSVRKGSKAGPWSIVVIKGKKVLHQRLVKILQQIPAHYEDVKKKYPRAFIAIEDKYGHRVYTESVNEGFTKYHIRLTKTRGWYGVWDKNGKQKFEGDRRYVTRQLKKLKTRMGNVQLKSLIDVATKRKGKNIEFDVVESVDEGGKGSGKKKGKSKRDAKSDIYAQDTWKKKKPKKFKKKYPPHLADMGESVDEGLGDNVLKNLKKYKKRAEKNKAAMDAARKRKKKESVDEDTKLDLLKLYNKAMKLPAKSPVQMKVRKKIDTLRKKIGMDEAKETGIDIARRVVKNKQHEKGLDLTTANFIMQIYDAYKKNPRLQKKLDKMPLLKMVKLAHLVMK